MAKDERERFIAEVALADKELSEAIKEYQKVDPSKQPDLAREKWKDVSQAMAKRVAIDRKYDALRNQREVTALTLVSALVQTIGEVGTPGKIREREEITREIEEEDPRLSGRDPRRW